MLGFDKLFHVCLKYNFSFILDSEGYKRDCIKMILKPNDNKKCSITVTGKGFKELFKNAISEIKTYRMDGN